MLEIFDRIEDHLCARIRTLGSTAPTQGRRRGLLFLEMRASRWGDLRGLAFLDDEAAHHQRPDHSAVQFIGGKCLRTAVHAPEQIFLCDGKRLSLPRLPGVQPAAPLRRQANKIAFLLHELPYDESAYDSTITLGFRNPAGLLSETIKEFPLPRTQIFGQHDIPVMSESETNST